MLLELFVFILEASCWKRMLKHVVEDECLAEANSCVKARVLRVEAIV